MHASKQKQTCPKCERNINTPNFNKHIACCKGKIGKKTEWVCEFCGISFNNAHGYFGHIQRSHIQREKQSEYGSKGIQKRIESGSIGVGLYFHSDETKEKLSILACERLAKHSKYSKNVEYKPGVILESSYEVRVAEILDELKVEWEKVRCGYVWDDNGKKRRYIPDFYTEKREKYTFFRRIYESLTLFIYIFGNYINGSITNTRYKVSLCPKCSVFPKLSF